MPPRRRQPLGELPLHLYIQDDDPDTFVKPSSPSKHSQASPNPSIILSPPKRRIMLAEGLLPHGSKSPGTKLFFDSRDTETTALMAALGPKYNPESGPSHQSRRPTPSSSSSSSSSSRSSYTSTAPSSSSSYGRTSDSSIGSSSRDGSSNLPATPRAPKGRAIGLAPSPEIDEYPNTWSSSTRKPPVPAPVFATPAPPTPMLITPSSLKRQRESASSANSSSPHTVTKRRTLPVAPPESPLDSLMEDLDDKENVPPQKKKPRPLEPPALKVRKEPIRTRPSTTTLSKAELRLRKEIMEAEVDIDDEMDV